MDGRGQVVIIDKEIYNPTALTIDYTNKRIYWADDNHILLSSMDGTQRRKGKPQIVEFEGFLDKGWLLNEIEGIFIKVLKFRFDTCREKLYFVGHVDGKVVSSPMFFSIPI